MNRLGKISPNSGQSPTTPVLAPLIKIALLGTDREPLPEISPDTPLGHLLSQVSHSEATPEERFLSLAGAITLHQQVGRRPQQTTIPGEGQPSPPADLPRCNLAAGRRLATILDSRFQDLLPEFLQRLAQAKQRVPAEHLPNLLERGTKLASLRPLLLPVIGQTGRWLAGQNPAWAYAAPEIETWAGIMAHWHANNPTRQQTLLRQLRHTRPELGRQLLQSIWKSTAPAARTSLIKIMETGLSQADEPFLEVALDDRNNTVRRKAAELLTFLPESRLCRRMLANTQGVLRWTPRLAQKITVLFPAVITPTLARDGVLPRPKGDASRIRSAQLTEMIRAVPLEHWTTTWQASPEAIVQAVQTSRWPRTLIKALATAAERQKNVEWVRVLLLADEYGVNTQKLVRLLPAPEFEQLLAQLNTPVQSLKESQFMTVLRRWPHPWSEAVSQQWIDFIAKHVTQAEVEDNNPDPAFRSSFKQFARLCPPTLTAHAAQTLLPLATAESKWRILLQDFVAILKFREAMLAEIYGNKD